MFKKESLIQWKEIKIKRITGKIVQSQGF